MYYKLCVNRVLTSVLTSESVERERVFSFHCVFMLFLFVTRQKLLVHRFVDSGEDIC